MTIRTRLTLWYAGVLFASALLVASLAYWEFAAERQKDRARRQLLEQKARAEQKEPLKPSQVEDEQEEDVVDLMRILLWCGLPGAMLGLGGGWWLMRKSLAPVAALTYAAARINERNLGEQLPRSGSGDELDRLTEVFNAMTARLDGSFQRIREFTLHASHELKTPLTVLHGELETALQDQRLPAPERERLLSQLDEVQRLSKIVDGLTLLTKADAGQVSLKFEPLRLDELVREAHADAQILAKSSDVQVNLVACDSVEMRGDRHRLRQLLLNLTDNAVKYNQPKGTVDIALRRLDSAVAEITVANTGTGIPPELLRRVFDRFFRGDPSHSSAVDGCGLGLSIAQWIVNAHRGTIEIRSLPDQHTTVIVRLPRAQEGKSRS